MTTETAVCVAASILLTATETFAAHQCYSGGEVIKNVQVVQVNWTSGVVDANLSDFYNVLLAGMFWVREYDTVNGASRSWTAAPVQRFTYQMDCGRSGTRTALALLAVWAGCGVLSRPLNAPKTPVTKDSNGMERFRDSGVRR
jgi:hypothetical protein